MERGRRREVKLSFKLEQEGGVQKQYKNPSFLDRLTLLFHPIPQTPRENIYKNVVKNLITHLRKIFKNEMETVRKILVKNFLNIFFCKKFAS